MEQRWGFWKDVQTQACLNQEIRIIAGILEVCTHPSGLISPVRVDLGVESDETWIRSFQTNGRKCLWECYGAAL